MQFYRWNANVSNHDNNYLAVHNCAYGYVFAESGYSIVHVLVTEGKYVLEN